MRAISLTEWVYYHLWKKDLQTGEGVTGINIPDTILYRWGQPRVWYFSSQSKKILKKTRDKMLDYNIEAMLASKKGNKEITPAGILYDSPYNIEDELENSGNVLGMRYFCTDKISTR